LSNHVNIEKGIANVHLPEIVDPIPIRNNIKVLYAECNPKLIYQGDAGGTLKGWNYMNDINIPLGRTTTILAMGEISTIFAQGMFSAVPLIVSPAEIAYLIHFLNRRGVENLDAILPKIRRKIRGIIRSANDRLRRGTLPLSSIKHLMETLASIKSELWVCRELIEHNFDVAFNPHKEGPDLYIGQGSIKIEVTKRMGYWNLKEYEAWTKVAAKNLQNSLIRFHPTAFLAISSLNLANKLEDELKQGDIVVVDISSLLEGSMLLGVKYFSKDPEKLSLKQAMENALKLAEKGRKSVIFYARAGGAPTSAAIGIDAKTVLNYINVY